MSTSGVDRHGHFLNLFWETSGEGVLRLEGGVVRHGNPAAETLLGRCGDDLRGAVFSTLLGPVVEGETTVTTPHGEQRRCRIHRVTSDDPPGELVVLRDITGIRSLERDLLERNAQLQSTLESIPFDFWMNDTDNRTIVQNSLSRKLWGDQAGRHMTEVTDDPDIIEIWNETNSRALRGETVVGEITYTVDGRKRIFRNVVAPVRAGEEIIGILGLNLDITDLKEALADRERLLKNLHHMVRNDLQIIQSALYLHINERELSGSDLLRHVMTQVQAICLVHDQLDTGGPIDTVDISDVARSLAPGACIPQYTEPVLCPIEQAVPLAVLLSEVLSWVSSTCVSRTEPGGATIDELRIVEGEIALSVRAVAGKAHPAHRDQTAPAVIRGLVDQLNGTLTIETPDTTRTADRAASTAGAAADDETGPNYRVSVRIPQRG